MCMCVYAYLFRVFVILKHKNVHEPGRRKSPGAMLQGYLSMYLAYLHELSRAVFVVTFVVMVRHYEKTNS